MWLYGIGAADIEGPIFDTSLNPTTYLLFFN